MRLLHILLLGAGLAYLIILLDNIAKPLEDLAAFGACFQADNLQSNADALVVDSWQDVFNLGIEHQWRFVGHRCKSQPDKLTFFEACSFLAVKCNLCTASGNIDKLALAIMVGWHLFIVGGSGSHLWCFANGVPFAFGVVSYVAAMPQQDIYL